MGNTTVQLCPRTACPVINAVTQQGRFFCSFRPPVQCQCGQPTVHWHATIANQLLPNQRHFQGRYMILWFVILSFSICLWKMPIPITFWRVEGEMVLWDRTGSPTDTSVHLPQHLISSPYQLHLGILVIPLLQLLSSFYFLPSHYSSSLIVKCLGFGQVFAKSHHLHLTKHRLSAPPPHLLWLIYAAV